MSRSRLDRFFARYADLLLRRRTWFALLLAVLVAGLAAFAPRLRFDNSPESFFLRGDPTVERYSRFRQLFGTDEYAFLVFEHEQAWTPAFIGELRKLTQALAHVPDVLEVTSILNVRHVLGEDDALVVRDFVSESVSSAAELARLRDEARWHPYYRDLFISADGNHLGIVLKTAARPGEIDYKIELTRRIREILAREPYRSWKCRAVGSPILDADVRRIVSSESGLFCGLILLTTSVVFFLVFRSWVAVLLPQFVAILSIVCAFGVMGLTHMPFTLLSGIVPSFLISIGVGPAIFLLSAFFLEVQRGASTREAVRRALSESASSSLLSTVTTAAGLLAFATSDIRPVEELGRTMGGMVMLSFAITMVVVPLALSLISRFRDSDQRREMLAGRVRVLEGLCGRVLGRPGLVVAIGAAFCVIALFGLLRLRVDYHYLGVFKSSTPLRQDYAFVDDVMKSSTSIELLVDTHRADGVKDPALLRMLVGLSDHVRTNFVKMGAKPYSVADLVLEIDKALAGPGASKGTIPETTEGVAQALLLYEMSGNDEVGKLASPDFRYARVRIGVANRPDGENRALFASIDDYVRHQTGTTLASVTVEPTGVVQLWVGIGDYLASSELEALGLTFLAVLLVMIGVLRSWRLGLTASLLNACAVLWIVGIMGWFEIWLDPYTILIASFALGILDDDTIHLMREIQQRFESGEELRAAIVNTLSSTGQGVFYLGAALMLSFLAYAASSVASLMKFGLLVALTVLLGAIVEFVLSPAVLLVGGERLFRRRAAAARGRLASIPDGPLLAAETSGHSPNIE